MAGQGFRGSPAVGHVFAQRSECAARTNDRLQQSSGCHPGAKLQAVGDEMFHPEVRRQGTQHTLEQLPDQHNVFAAAHRRNQSLGSLAAQLRFQNVVEVLLAKQVQAVAGDAAQ